MVPLNSFVEAGGLDSWPEWDAGGVVGASLARRTAHEGGTHAHYLGVWRRSGRSVVARYSRAPDGAFSNPEIVVASPFAIRSVAVWSMIDGITISHGYPRGELGITLDTGAMLLACSVSGIRLTSSRQ